MGNLILVHIRVKLPTARIYIIIYIILGIQYLILEMVNINAVFSDKMIESVRY
jgi:hypothetical protein